MSPDLIAALATGGAVAIAAMVTAIILTGRAEKPWSLLADERGRRAGAEAARDIARADEQRIATDSAQKDAVIREQKSQIADLIARLRLVPGRGADSLREQLEWEEADDGAAGPADLGGDPVGAVPRVTAPGSFPVDPKLRG